MLCRPHKTNCDRCFNHRHSHTEASQAVKGTPDLPNAVILALLTHQHLLVRGIILVSQYEIQIGQEKRDVLRTRVQQVNSAELLIERCIMWNYSTSDAAPGSAVQ